MTVREGSNVNFCLVFQIAKLLVVDPRKRLTSAEALSHPFFQCEVRIT